MSPTETQRSRLEFECRRIEESARRALDFTLVDSERQHLLSIDVAALWLLERIAAERVDGAGVGGSR